MILRPAWLLAAALLAGCDAGERAAGASAAENGEDPGRVASTAADGAAAGAPTSSSASPASVPTATTPGDPLPDLDPAAAAAFRRGAGLFARVFAEEDGLGPLFNETACNACHTDPADGGTGDQRVVRASRVLPGGGCDPLAQAGGPNVRRQATERLRAAGGGLRAVPDAATHVSEVSVPLLFGLGLVEAVPTETLRALADPDDRDGDGISGRVGRDAAGRPARFGRKADVATLRAFVESAAFHEMGLTSPVHPVESDPGDRSPGRAPADFPPGSDPAPDPELSEGDVADLTAYVRYLAPLAVETPDDPALAERARRGGRLFGDLGCAACHVPSLAAGPGGDPALAGRTVRTYSDFLLHDMGEDFEGACAPGAGPREWRTASLVGLSHRNRFLHDHRALRVEDAVLAHGGEALRARQAFERLDPVRRGDLVTFLLTR